MKEILSVFSILFFIVSQSINSQEIKQINSQDVKQMIDKKEKIVLLDVRTKGEVDQGHIKGAVHIDVNQPDALSRIGKLDKSKTYVVYCRTKNRSGVVTKFMIENGFKKVYQMMDGIVGWNGNNYPVDKN